VKQIQGLCMFVSHISGCQFSTRPEAKPKT